MNLKQPLKNLFKIPMLHHLLIGTCSWLILAGMQSLGVLQGLELRVFDQMLLHRPTASIDQRILLINETEEDILRYGHPLSDQLLANGLQALTDAGARVIGVDKYRNMPVAPGSPALDAVLQQHDNIVWIFFAGNHQSEYIQAPALLANNPERTGFNDIIEDQDGVTRRGLLFLEIKNHSYYAFSLILALHFLAAEQIHPETDAQGYMRLNGVSLPAIEANFGAYQHIDNRGYQVMLDYPGLPQAFTTYCLADLLEGKIPESAVRGKVVLIGSNASSLPDYRVLPNELRKFGVDYHAYLVSQLLTSALSQKLPIQAWPDISEYFCLGLWCLLGSVTGMYRGSLKCIAGLMLGSGFLIVFSAYLSLIQGWWIPVIAPFAGWFCALGMSVLYFSSRIRIERRQLMQLFASHVSPEVANRLWEAREQFFSEGRVRPDMLTATVMFTDISDFTTLAEGMEPLGLMNWLNQYMVEISRLVVVHGGIVNKYIGDAIMALFGVPVKLETETEVAREAQQAVLCALSVSRRLSQLNREWQAQGLPWITMRIGIYTGPMVAGSFGGLLRMEYTVIGDTVNTAARLEGFDKSVATPNKQHPCRILIGETTYKHVQHLCEVQLVGECKLKGKKKTIKIYQVLSQLDRP